MIFFLYGQDTFRSRRKLKEIKQKFLAEVDPTGGSVTSIGPDEISLSRLSQAAAAASLLSRRRLVIVERLFDRKEAGLFAEIANYLEKPSAGLEDNILVFWDEVASEDKGLTKERGRLFRFLAGQKLAQEFKPLSNAELTAWVQKEVGGRGGQISREAAVHLVALAGGDLWQIDQEIDKLVHYKAGQKLRLGGQTAPDKIETADVRELVVGVFDEQVFALTDALSARNRALSAKLLEEQLRGGESDEYLLYMITRQFRILTQVRQALDSGVPSRSLAKELKLHPFVAQKSASQVRNFSLEQLKRLLAELIGIDYQVKTGRVRPRTALDQLLARL